MGKIKLPSAEERQKDIDYWMCRSQQVEPNVKSFNQFQGDYVHQLIQATDYPHLDIQLFRDNLHKWD